ncbi:protein takeout-like [Periplaneta americana]|uniref:protein takeout-like n=1 Tax=Periplaneta americana TaxID=6978 RepID=UPI0037E98DCE
MLCASLWATLVVALASVFITPVLAELPDYVPICRLNNRELNTCLLNATVTLMPYVAKGIPELNIPPLEPLFIPMVKLNQATQSVNFQVALKNLKVYGLSYYVFRDVNLDMDMLVVRGSLHLPRISLEADYNIEGRLLLMPIKGNGLFSANASNAMADFNIKARHRDVNGTLYLEAADTMLKFSVGKVKFNLDNLFDGNELGKTTNAFVRENSQKIFEEIRPAVESVAAMLVDDTCNKLFRAFPAHELFPYN